MNLYSSRLKRCGDTFFTTDTVKLSKENWVWCTSLACIDSADLSHFSSLKHPRCPLVRLWHSCTVLPKYVSLSPHNLQIQRYITFLDLQLRCRGIWRLLPFMTRSLFSFTRGHWRQPRLLQCWSSDVILGKLSCLLRTTLFPIELFFFKANIMRVSPINCLSSLSRLRTSDLNSERPLKSEQEKLTNGLLLLYLN